MITKEKHIAPCLLGCTSQVCAKTNKTFRLYAKHNNVPEIVALAQFANDFARGSEIFAIPFVAHEQEVIAPEFGLDDRWPEIPKSLDHFQIESLGVHLQKTNLCRQFAGFDQGFDGSNRNVDRFRKGEAFTDEMGLKSVVQ